LGRVGEVERSEGGRKRGEKRKKEGVFRVEEECNGGTLVSEWCDN
jgi:hypothetical protein